MSRSYPLLLGSIASEPWAIEPAMLRTPWPRWKPGSATAHPGRTKSRDGLIADGNARFYAAGMPMEMPGGEAARPAWAIPPCCSWWVSSCPASARYRPCRAVAARAWCPSPST